jgi:hypothetical protein
MKQFVSNRVKSMTKQLPSEAVMKTAAHDVVQIETLIKRLARAAEIMDVEISYEEQLSSVRDPSDPAYPMIARTLTARRDNLRASVVSLQTLIQANNPEPYCL